MENKEIISKAVAYTNSNATSNEITIQNVADYAGFSIDYFNRIFLSHTGFTVMAYINYIRLKKAIELLRTTDKSILEIALKVGYDSHEGFIKAFKKQYGITPSHYRKQKKNIVLYWGELSDKSIGARFVHANSDFQLMDTNYVIDYLLEKDAKRYGYLCITIKGMGLDIAVYEGDITNGFICIGDDRNGGYYLEIATENFELLANWIKRFPEATAFYSNNKPEYVQKQLMSMSISKETSSTPQALYFGEKLACTLPDNMVIRPLTYEDRDFIMKWANGKQNGYIKHLLNENHYRDEAVLEYGVFLNHELIAIAGCGIDEVHGFKINNSCIIRFTDKKSSDELYHLIFSFVTNDILDRNIIPFDDIQHGKYAISHGDFQSTDLGFEIVNWRYDIH